MSKVAPFIVFVLALALVCCGCADSVSPDFSFGPKPAEPGESPTPEASAGESPTPEASAGEILPPKASESPKAPVSQPTVNAKESIWGELSGDQYINKAFGFTATIPEGWVLASKKEIALYSGMAADLIETISDLRSNSNVMLMICSKLPLGSTDFIPSINISYNGKADLQVVNPSLFDMYLDNVKTLYTDAYEQLFSNVEVNVSGEQSYTINGREYYIVKVEAVFDENTLYQDQYFTQAGDGMICITATYYNTADKSETDSFIESIVFK